MNVNAVLAAVEQMRVALEQIASGNTPCQNCGQVHVERTVTNHKGDRWTWADPIDGHAYRKTDTRMVAANALDDTVANEATQ